MGPGVVCVSSQSRQNSCYTGCQMEHSEKHYLSGDTKLALD